MIYEDHIKIAREVVEDLSGRWELYDTPHTDECGGTCVKLIDALCYKAEKWGEDGAEYEDLIEDVLLYLEDPEESIKAALSDLEGLVNLEKEWDGNDTAVLTEKAMAHLEWANLIIEGERAFNSGGASDFVEAIDPEEYERRRSDLEEVAPVEWGFAQTFEQCELSGECCRISLREETNGLAWVVSRTSICHKCPIWECKYRNYGVLWEKVEALVGHFVARKLDWSDEDQLYLMDARMAEMLARNAATNLEDGHIWRAEHNVYSIVLLEKRWGEPRWKKVLQEFPEPEKNAPSLGCHHCGSTRDPLHVEYVRDEWADMCPRCGALR